MRYWWHKGEVVLEYIKLSELAQIYNGNSINKTVKQQKYTGLTEGRNFIATKDVGFDGTVTYENGVKIPFDEPKFKTAPADCVFVCSEGGSAGKKTAYITQEVCFGNKLYAIVKNSDLYYAKYIYFFTRSELFFKQFKGLLNGIIGGVSSKNFGTIQIPITDLPTQQRIVTRIEELFSQLDSGVETLKKTKAQLAVYRQAVLKEAFECIDKTDTIRNMTSIVTSGSRGWAKYYSDKGAKFIRIGNLTRTGISIDLSDVQYVSLPEKAEGLRSRLQANDILVSITADLGSIGIVPSEIGEAYINQHIAMVRFKNANQAKFMAYYLRSDIGQKYLLKNKRGAGKLGLGLDDIRDSRVPLVSDEQAKDIVSEIESRLSVCDSIEKTVDEALQQAEGLRQSILKKAFEGELL